MVKIVAANARSVAPIPISRPVRVLKDVPMVGILPAPAHRPTAPKANARPSRVLNGATIAARIAMATRMVLRVVIALPARAALVPMPQPMKVLPKASLQHQRLRPHLFRPSPLPRRTINWSPL